MKRVYRIQTADGVLHEEVKGAVRHAEKVYGEALSKLVHELLRVHKSLAMHEFVDGNLERFVALKHLREDIKLVEDPEDSE